MPGEALFDLLGLTMIVKAGGEAPHDAAALFELALQHAAVAGTDGAAIETGHHAAAKIPPKLEAGLGALCSRWAVRRLSL